MTPVHTAFPGSQLWVGRVGICRSSWERLNTGRHEKAAVQCLTDRLATFHGAPR